MWKGRWSEKRDNVRGAGLELTMRRARRGRTLTIIKRRQDFCKGAISPQTRKTWARTQLKTHDKFCGGGKVGYLMQCLLGVRGRDDTRVRRDTWTRRD